MVYEVSAAVGGGVEVQVATLKDPVRVSDKAKDDYATRVPGPAIGWVYDIVRMRFLCTTAKQIKAVLKRVIADPRVKCVLKGIVFVSFPFFPFLSFPFLSVLNVRP